MYLEPITADSDEFAVYEETISFFRVVHQLKIKKKKKNSREKCEIGNGRQQ